MADDEVRIGNSKRKAKKHVKWHTHSLNYIIHGYTAETRNAVTQQQGNVPWDWEKLPWPST